MTAGSRTIVPVILSGGSGSRLWPLSRENRPKQLMGRAGELTLLQQTARRAADPMFEPLIAITGAHHGAAVAEQIGSAGLSPAAIVLEPVPRNTAAAAAIAALLTAQNNPDGLLLLMPADHHIGDDHAFRATVRAAAETAEGNLVLFGIKPTAPASGYGYIRVGAPLPGTSNAKQVAAFVEKPVPSVARTYVESGEYLWNSGIFLLPAKALLEELSRHAPEVLHHARAALEGATRENPFVRLDEAAFSRCTSVSIDYAVMERTKNAVVVAADFDWADIGTWSALWEVGEHDDAGNTAIGDVIVEDTRDSYVRSEGPLVVALGVEGMIVIATPDAILIADRSRDQDIRKIVDRLKAERRDVT